MWRKSWNINVKTTNCDMTPDVQAYIDGKLHALHKLVVVEDEDAEVICEIEIEKALEQQHGPIWRAEMNLTVNGELFRAETKGESINEALDELKDEMSKRLRRAKGKQTDMLRRGGAAIKKMLRFWE